MKTSTQRLGLALLAMAALLAACGGGDDEDCCIAAPGVNGDSQLPSSATASSEGLVAYLQDLIANHTDDAGEPVALGSVTLPASETAEPLAVN